jgi:hypothetical protein
MAQMFSAAGREAIETRCRSAVVFRTLERGGICADGPGVVMLSNFIPELENASDRFMAHGIQFKGQSFLWFTQHRYE